MKIYLAGPLFTAAELAFNSDLARQLRERGYEVFLPQDETVGHVNCGPGWTNIVFEIDRDGIDSSDIVVAVMDGTQVDDGTAWECGYACAKGKSVIGLRTDFRTAGEEEGPVNLMLAESSRCVVRNVDALFDVLLRLNRKLSA